MRSNKTVFAQALIIKKQENEMPSYQKQFIGWINIAKRQETKEKRIRKSIQLLEKGEKLGLR